MMMAGSKLCLQGAKAIGRRQEPARTNVLIVMSKFKQLYDPNPSALSLI